MKIETKFEWGEELWHMHKNQPKKSRFTELSINSTYSGYNDGGWGTPRSYPIRILYGTGIGAEAIWKLENELFRTKEELIASL